MKFSNKRGRPKKIKDKIDLGTRELQEKKKLGIGESYLLTLKKQDLIDEIEYQTALWFRYLYSVKFGNPNVITAYDNTELRGLNLFQMSDKKRKKMEGLYGKISRKLQNRGLKNFMLDVCVFEKNILANWQVLAKFKKGVLIINTKKV